MRYRIKTWIEYSGDMGGKWWTVKDRAWTLAGAFEKRDKQREKLEPLFRCEHLHTRITKGGSSWGA